MTKRPKLRDIAAAAGVSEMTVSRALRGSGDVSPATRERIQAIAAELGYVPNRIAGALASARVNLVGVVVPSLENHVFPQVVSGVGDGLAGSGMQAFIGATGYDPEREREVVAEMLSWRPAGLIVTGIEHGPETTAMLANAPCTVVEIMDTDGTPLSNAVGISHHQAGLAMAREIARRGYGNIAYAGTGAARDLRGAKRLEGFRQGLAQAGLALVDQELHDGGSSIARGRAMTAALLQRHPQIDCIYYSSDMLSVGGLMHCIANGIAVPGQLALAGFNNLEILEGMPVHLATTDAHRHRIGRRAAQIILEAGQGDAPIVETLPAEVLPGGSL